MDQDAVWKGKMENDISELQTDVATIKANDANHMRELRSIKKTLDDLRDALSIKPPIWPQLSLGIAGLALVGSIGVFALSPLNATVREQGKEMKDLYYSIGRLEALQEQEE